MNLRRLICLVLRCRHGDGLPTPVVSVLVGDVVLTFKGNFKMDVKTNEGPFQVVVVDFLDADGKPTGAPVENATFSSSDTAVATVDSSGIVTLTQAVGSVTILAAYATFTVTGVLSVSAIVAPAVSGTMNFVPVTKPGV